jgi:hypothetical protein
VGVGLQRRREGPVEKDPVHAHPHTHVHAHAQTHAHALTHAQVLVSAWVPYVNTYARMRYIDACIAGGRRRRRRRLLRRSSPRTRRGARGGLSMPLHMPLPKPMPLMRAPSRITRLPHPRHGCRQLARPMIREYISCTHPCMCIVCHCLVSMVLFGVANML